LINPKTRDSWPQYFTDVNGTVFFTADDGVHGVQLWKTDGTESGTVLVKDIPGGYRGALPGNLTNVNGTLFFTANVTSSGFQLWKSDGTEAGTVLVKDIRPGGINPSPGGLINDNGTLLFIIYAYPGRQLWKSDGTPDGTVLIKNFTGVTTSVASLTNVNGTAFFVASDGIQGAELWKSDGTTDGTVIVKDIRPGSAGSDPFELFNSNGTLFFTATASSCGRATGRRPALCSSRTFTRGRVARLLTTSPTSTVRCTLARMTASTDTSCGFSPWTVGLRS
jgi:ELWxxDGT repeat protein